VTAKRREPRWLTPNMVLAIHADQLHQHGGAIGLRDQGLFESALQRPQHRWQYDPKADLCFLAAAYGIGLAKNHAFVDGNKRIPFQAMYVFLGLNGLRIVADELEVVSLMVATAGEVVEEDHLAEWLRQHTHPR
jgi:death-on-curing protein